MVAFPFNPRDLQRMLKRMGITIEEINAERVRIELADGKVLEVSEPQAVMIIKSRGQSPMLYVVGELREVEAAMAEPAGGEEPFTEEDVALVAEQAGVSMEEARKALEETGGDIAEAILRLQERKSG